MVLETERLTMREMGRDDASNLLGIFEDPVAMRYYPSTKGRRETQEWISWNLRSYEEDGIGLWIVESKGSGRFLGECGLTMQEVEGVREPEVGYHFLREHWGQGFATEAAAASLEYGFDSKGYDRIICLPAADNLPSRRVAERLGMALEREVERHGQRVCVYAIERSM